MMCIRAGRVLSGHVMGVVIWAVMVALSGKPFPAFTSILTRFSLIFRSSWVLEWRGAVTTVEPVTHVTWSPHLPELAIVLESGMVHVASVAPCESVTAAQLSVPMPLLSMPALSRHGAYKIVTEAMRDAKGPADSGGSSGSGLAEDSSAAGVGAGAAGGGPQGATGGQAHDSVRLDYEPLAGPLSLGVRLVCTYGKSLSMLQIINCHSSGWITVSRPCMHLQRTGSRGLLLNGTG